jgi:sugar lactone lactonase YvrE
LVQFFLREARRQLLCAALITAGVALLPAAIWATDKSKGRPADAELWEMQLESGRKLTWEHSINSEIEVKPNRGFWNKLVDVIAGEPNFHSLVRPYSVTTDSRGRIIVTDPGAAGVHIFDFTQHKYKFIQHLGKVPMLAPQCVAVDAQDNIYVTDSDAGVIFVFEPSGKFLHAIGSLRGGEGYFKRPTGIAVDSAAQQIYVTDTLRDKVFILDMQGSSISPLSYAWMGRT